MAPVPGGNTDEPKRECSEVSDMETPPVNITVESESSGSDEEVVGPAQLGYQPLPQDPHEQGDYEHGDEDEDEATAPAIDHVIAQSLSQHNYPAVPNNDWEAGPDAETEERKDVWSKARLSAPSMSKDEAERIKLAMSSFSLPPCTQPEWARTVNEDEWKRRLYARLNIPATSAQTAATSSQATGTSQESATTRPCSSSHAVSASQCGQKGTLQTDVMPSSTTKSSSCIGTISRDNLQSSQNKAKTVADTEGEGQPETQTASQEMRGTKVHDIS